MSWSLLLELLAKSSLIAGAGLGLSALLKTWPAADRAAILRGSVVLLIALPVLIIIAPGLPLAWLPAPEAAVASIAARDWTLDLQPLVAAQVKGSVPASSPWLLLAAAVYGLGLTIVAGRFLLGLYALHRWTAEGKPAAHRVWLEVLRRLDASGRTRLIVSARRHAPLSWGLPPGTVLISEECLRRPETAPAVLAHELAHIRRADWPFMALSWLAVALFWFNPLVWLLHAVLSARTEDAADAAAVAQVDHQSYARALVDLASDFAHPAALGMAGPPKSLTRRIASIMKTPRTSPSRPLAMALTITAMAAVATPLAAVELTARAPLSAAAEEAAATAETVESVQAAHRPADGAPRLSPPAPPQPPAPPAPPAPSNGWPQTPGAYRFHSNHSDAEIARHAARAQAEAARARAEASNVRAEADRIQAEARRQAVEAHAEASAARIEADRIRLDLDTVRSQALAAAEKANVEARQAMVQARVEMRKGADELERGADELRAEGVKLRDPAYRAQVIARNRARAEAEGRLYDVSDAQLRALSRSLPQQAIQLDRQAQALRRQASQGL